MVIERTPKSESAHKAEPREESFPAVPAGARTRDVSITSPQLYHLAIPANNSDENNNNDNSNFIISLLTHSQSTG